MLRKESLGLHQILPVQSKVLNTFRHCLTKRRRGRLYFSDLRWLRSRISDTMCSKKVSDSLNTLNDQFIIKGFLLPRRHRHSPRRHALPSSIFIYPGPSRRGSSLSRDGQTSTSTSSSGGTRRCSQARERPKSRDEREQRLYSEHLNH